MFGLIGTYSRVHPLGGIFCLIRTATLRDRVAPNLWLHTRPFVTVHTFIVVRFGHLPRQLPLGTRERIFVRLLFGPYLAILEVEAGARIGVLDTISLRSIKHALVPFAPRFRIVIGSWSGQTRARAPHADRVLDLRVLPVKSFVHYDNQNNRCQKKRRRERSGILTTKFKTIRVFD